MNNLQELAEQRMRLAYTFSFPFMAVWVVVSLLAGVLAGVMAGTIGAALGVTVCGLLAGALYVSYALIGALRDVRWMIVESVSSHLENEHSKREAIERAAENAGAQLNVNAGPGNMTVKNRPISIKHINGNVTTLDLNQTVNQTDQTRKLEIPAADVRWVCEQMAGGYGHSKSKWVGARVELPYSRLTVDYTIYKALLDALARGGAIEGRGERASGRLKPLPAAELVEAIEAGGFPGAGAKGIILELPAAATS